MKIRALTQGLTAIDKYNLDNHKRIRIGSRWNASKRDTWRGPLPPRPGMYLPRAPAWTVDRRPYASIREAVQI